MALLGHFNPNGPRAISIQMAQQGHFNPVQVDSALNHPLKCLVISPVIGKEVSKGIKTPFTKFFKDNYSTSIEKHLNAKFNKTTL